MEEVWKPVPDSDRYMVSSFGRVRNIVTDKILKPFPNQKGYLYLELYGTKKGRFALHSLVLTAFVGPCPRGQQCRHLDHNKANCRLDNLCWGTAQENMIDNSYAGKCGPQVMTAELAREIRSRNFKYGEIKAFCEEHGIGRWVFDDVRRGHTFKHLDKGQEDA